MCHHCELFDFFKYNPMESICQQTGVKNRNKSRVFGKNEKDCAKKRAPFPEEEGAETHGFYFSRRNVSLSSAQVRQVEETLSRSRGVWTLATSGPMEMQSRSGIFPERTPHSKLVCMAAIRGSAP